MLTQVKLFATCLVAFLVIDFVWIAVLMKNFYIEQLRPIGRINGEAFTPVLWSALGVYVVLSIGLVHFVLPKIKPDSTWLYTFATGALLGLVVYGTYDLTNHATLKDWTLPMTFVDIAWGSTLCGSVTVILKALWGDAL